VLAPDLPGFGRTPPPPQARWPAGPDVREQADQLLAWMEARGIGRAVLFGHSVGCQTVVDVATRFPDRVERVILAAPPFEPGRRSLAVSLPRLALGALFEVVSLPLLLGVEYGTAGPARAIQQALRSMDDPVERKLPHVPVPTLVIHGALDPLVSRPWVERVAALVPLSTLVEVQRVGHAMHYSAATVTAAVVTRFLRDDLADAVLVPADDPQRDPFGPPQPISPAWHGRLDLAMVVLALVFPSALRWGPQTRRVLTAAATASVANNLVTDRGTVDCRRLPMVTHAAIDVASGVSLLVAATTTLRREPPAGRWATAAFGLYHLVAAALTAKPTGGARVCRQAAAGRVRTARGPAMLARDADRDVDANG
jgi:predicted alpha/beta hydrolase family esterase